MTEKAEGIQAESSIARLQKTINNTSLKKHQNYYHTGSLTSENVHSYRRLRENYCNALEQYASTVDLPLFLAVYWRNWDVWTLTKFETLRSEGNRRILHFIDAMKANYMSELLGDFKIATVSPIRLVFEIEPVQLRFGQEQFVMKIRGVKIFAKDTEIQDKETRSFAMFLLLYGNWETNTEVKMTNDLVATAVEFIAEPLDDSNIEKQGFETIGDLSQIFMRIHAKVTEGDPLPRLIPTKSLPKVEDLIPTDVTNRELPIWVFRLEPS